MKGNRRQETGAKKQIQEAREQNSKNIYPKNIFKKGTEEGARRQRQEARKQGKDAWKQGRGRERQEAGNRYRK